MENREFISIEDVAMWYPYKGKDKAKATGKKNWIKAVDGVSLSIKKGENSRNYRGIRMWKIYVGADSDKIGEADKGRLLYQWRLHGCNDQKGCKRVSQDSTDCFSESI